VDWTAWRAVSASCGESARRENTPSDAEFADKGTATLKMSQPARFQILI
jgi:hypothetical protein